MNAYVLLTNNYLILLRYLLKFKEIRYCRDKTELLNFVKENQKRDQNKMAQSPSTKTYGRDFCTPASCILYLMNTIVCATRYLCVAGTKIFVDNLAVNFSECHYQDGTSNVYRYVSHFVNYSQHETIKGEETLKFLTLSRFPEFYERVSENNNIKVMLLEERKPEEKRKSPQTESDDEEGNIQIHLIGASSDTVTVAKREESEHGKNYNVFEIVIPNKQTQRKSRVPTDDESAEYRLYKKSYGEPRDLSATRSASQSKVSKDPERKESIIHSNKSRVQDLEQKSVEAMKTGDPKNAPVNTVENQKDAATTHQRGNTSGLQQRSATQQFTSPEEVHPDEGSIYKYPSGENLSYTSGAPPGDSRFDPKSNNYIYATDASFANPFDYKGGWPFPHIGMLDTETEHIQEFADINEPNHQGGNTVTYLSKKADIKQPILENNKSEQVSDITPSDKYSLSGSPKPSHLLREAQPIKPVEGKYSPQSTTTTSRLTREGEPEKPVEGKYSPHGSSTPSRFTRADGPVKPVESKYIPQGSPKPSRAEELVKPVEGKYGPQGSPTPSRLTREEELLQPVAGKYSPQDSPTPSPRTREGEPVNPVEGKYSPQSSPTPSRLTSEEEPVKPVEGKYTSQGSPTPSRLTGEEEPLKPVAGKYTPQGSPTPSRFAHAEEPVKPVEGRYNTQSSHKPSRPTREEETLKPVAGKYSPQGSPTHARLTREEEPLQPVADKYTPQGSPTPSRLTREEESLKPVEGKYSPQGSPTPSRLTREGEPETTVEGKYTPRGSPTPSRLTREEESLKPVEGKYTPHGSPTPSRLTREGEPERPVEGKYTLQGSPTPSRLTRSEGPVKPVEGKYSNQGSPTPSRLTREDEPLKPVAGKYTLQGSPTPSRLTSQAEPVKPVEGRYITQVSPTPSRFTHAEPERHVEGKYSPQGSPTPSRFTHTEEPVKPVEGKYSPEGSPTPSHLTGAEELLKPIGGKYRPQGSPTPSRLTREEEPVKSVGGKYSPQGSPTPSRLTREEPERHVECKYSSQGSPTPSRFTHAEEPVKPVEGRYNTQGSPTPSRLSRQAQSIKPIEGTYSPQGSILPLHDNDQPTALSAGKQHFVEPLTQSDDQQPVEKLSGKDDIVTIGSFEIPEDKYTIDKYSSVKAHWQPDLSSLMESQDTEGTAQKLPDTTEPKYSAGDRACVESKAPKVTEDTTLKPADEKFSKSKFTPYREGLGIYGLESELEYNPANGRNGEKDESSPSKRSWLSTEEHAAPVVEPPFTKTAKEDDQGSRRVAFWDGTYPNHDGIKSVAMPIDTTRESNIFTEMPDKIKDFEHDRPKDRPESKFMVFAGHVDESSPFLHKSEFNASPIEDQKSLSDVSSTRRDINSRDTNQANYSAFPYVNDNLVYAGEVVEQSPFAYDEYMQQRVSDLSENTNASYSTARDQSYSQQREPSYAQQQQDRSHSQQRQPSYSQQRDPSFDQQDRSYSQQREPSYSQQGDPSFDQQDRSYSQQREPSYSQQEGSIYGEQSNRAYSQQQDPHVGQQQDRSYSQQQKEPYVQGEDWDGGGQTIRDYTGTRQVSFKQPGDSLISEYELTLPQRQKHGSDQTDRQKKAIIILVKAKHLIPDKDDKKMLTDSSQTGPELGGERDKENEGFKPNKNNMETTTEGNYDPYLIDDDENTFCTQGTQTFPMDEDFEATRLSRNEPKRSVDTTGRNRTTYPSTDGSSQVSRKGESLPGDEATVSDKDKKLSADESINRSRATYPSIRGSSQVSRKGESLPGDEATVSDKDKKLSADESINRSRATYPSIRGSSQVSRKGESLCDDETTVSDKDKKLSADDSINRSRTTYPSIRGSSQVSRKGESLRGDETTVSDKDKKLSADDSINRTRTTYPSVRGSFDVTRRAESVASQRQRSRGPSSLTPSEKPRKEKGPKYSRDSNGSKRDSKLKSSTDGEDEYKLIPMVDRRKTDDRKRKIVINKLPEFEVVASAALSSKPADKQQIQPSFYKGELAYSMNVQSDNFNGTCNFYLDPKLRKIVRNAIIACADKKK